MHGHIVWIQKSINYNIYNYLIMFTVLDIRTVDFNILNRFNIMLTYLCLFFH